jgi:hypothetical protein
LGTISAFAYRQTGGNQEAEMAGRRTFRIYWPLASSPATKVNGDIKINMNVTANFQLLVHRHLRLRYQGPMHTPRMHRSLQAYCATLNPTSWEHSSFRRQVSTRPHDARAPSTERWNFVGENCPVVFADYADFHGTSYVLQFCDMGHDGFTSSPRNACWGFFSPWKIRRLQLGLNPWTWVLKASTLTPRPPKPLHRQLTIYKITQWDSRHYEVWRIALCKEP